METHKRSIIKAVTWRVIAIIITISVAFILTKKLVISLGIGIADSIAKIFAYYIHERAWNKSNFGRK